MTAAVAQDPDASAVVTFLNSYFTAINSHNYQDYITLLTPPLQQGMTPASFDSGFQGTSDSAETLDGISVVADGDIGAVVTFTSNQAPAAANHDQACTDWNITLFLQQSGSGYLIDQPPQGYHAASAACS